MSYYTNCYTKHAHHLEEAECGVVVPITYRESSKRAKIALEKAVIYYASFHFEGNHSEQINKLWIKCG